MTRAINSTELTKLRLDSQWSELFLAIHTPAVVYTARVNQSIFLDPIYQITYDTGSGTLANVIPGMTMYVGSSPGAWDKGLVRIRKTPTISVFEIGETSEINWADNDYLTVVDEFGLWPRHIRLIETTPYMDYDIAYSDQHSLLNPYPVLGPDRVLWLTGSTVDVLLDASGSWVLDSTISSFLWTAPGASATLGLDTATPTITYNAPGTYRVGCSVTAANGKSTTGYRYIFVYSEVSMPITAFQLLSCRGDFTGGGWEFSVKLYDQAGSSIRPRSKVLLFTKDWYGGIEEKLGPDSGLENILAVGWVDIETLQYTPDMGTVTFSARGPASWLQNMSGFPLGVRRASGTSTAWTEVDSLTVDKGLWHLLHWRTTASICMDSILPGDTKSLPSAEAGATSIWEQLLAVGDLTIMAPPRCDRHGRLFIQVDSQYLPTASRDTIPVVMEITKADWSGEIVIERAQSRKCSMLELSGIVDDTDAPVMSWARGGVFTLYGMAQSIEHLLLDNQDAANMLAGNVFAQRNNEYPSIEIHLAENNRFIDVAPLQYLTITLSPADNPRGVSWSSKRIIPRRISYQWDEKIGFLSTTLECEGETGGAAAVPGVTVPITPPPIVGDGDLGVPDFGDWGAWPGYTPGSIDLPGWVPQEPQLPPEPGTCPVDAPANGPFDANIVGLLIGDGETALFGHLPAVLRSSSHINKTRYEIRGIFEKYNTDTLKWEETSEDAFYVVNAHAPGGTVIATGVHDPVTNLRKRTGVISTASAQKIAYISVQISQTEFLRPTSITGSGGAGPLMTINSPGIVKWGLFKGGIWASHTDMISSTSWLNPYGMSNGGDFNLSGNLPYPARPMIVRQHCYMECIQNGYVGGGDAKGGHVWLDLGGTLWWETVPITSAYLTQIHQMTMSSDDSPSVYIPGYHYGNVMSYYRFHHWITAWLHPIYRLSIWGVSIYNLCPLSSWEEWLT